MPMVKQSITFAFLASLMLSGCGASIRSAPPKVTLQPEILRNQNHTSVSRQQAVSVVEEQRTGQSIEPGKNLVSHLNMAAKNRNASEPASTEDTFNLNLTNVGVRDLSELILGELLETNFLIESDVSGQISLSTPEGVRRSDLIPVLSAALQSQDAELIFSGGLYQVVANNQSSAVISSGSGVRPQITSIKLRKTSASYMKRTLLPVAKDLVEITADETLDLLILAGRARHVNSLKDLVSTLDVDALEGKSFGLYALDHASVDEVTLELEEIFPASAAYNLITLRRMNALLVISDTDKDLRKLESWVQTLDQVGGRDHRSLHVYQAVSGQPLQLATVLRNIFVAGTSGSAPDVDSGNPSLFDRDTGEGLLNPILGSETSEDLPEGGANSTETRLPPATGELRIIPDERTDRLFIFANEREWSEIQTALQKLDTPPQQVMIEATIVEVALNDNLRYGLQFMLNSGDASFNLADSGAGGLSSGSGGLGFVFDNGGSARVILDALSSVTDVNVISSPRLMVLGEETATLQIGDQVPVASQSAVPINSADARIVNSIEFRDTGVILRVTPHIGAGDTILVDVDQEISDVVATTTSNIDSPTIRQRRVSSKISVQDGETVAFAGLTRNTVSDSKSGIPIARDLPLVGPLFGSTDQTANRSELLILLTPRLVRNLDDARTITDELRGRLSSINSNNLSELSKAQKTSQ